MRNGIIKAKLNESYVIQELSSEKEKYQDSNINSMIMKDILQTTANILAKAPVIKRKALILKISTKAKEEESN